MYVKLFSSLLDSSIMLHDVYTRYIWIGLLMIADDEGFIDMTTDAIARRLGIEEERVVKAIDEFQKPDKLSRNQDFEGRRLEKIRDSFGWQILNYKYYRALERKRQRQQYMKEYMAKRRTCKQAVNFRKQSVNKVSRQAEAEAEAEAEAINTTPLSDSKNESDLLFEKFWTNYPRKEGKGACRKIWSRLKPNAELISRMLAAIEAQKRSEKWTKDNGQFIPMPATWLNQTRWEDEVNVEVIKPKTWAEKRREREANNDSR